MTNALTYYHSARPPSFGPFYFAVAIDTMLYGVVLTLAFFYYTTHKTCVPFCLSFFASRGPRVLTYARAYPKNCLRSSCLK